MAGTPAISAMGFPRTGSTRARTFCIMDALFQSKQGLWALCDECSALVDDGKWAQLAEHAYSKFIERNTVARYDAAKLRAQFSDLVHLFAMHRIVGH